MGILTGIISGEFGKSVKLTLKKDGVAVDISSYTTITVYIRGETKNLTKVASFVTDGTDGEISFSFDSGELDRSGEWEAQVYLDKTGERSKSDIFQIDVGESIT